MGSLVTRGVGALQVLGGGLEVAFGVGGFLTPEPLTTAGGVILIAHGGDTVIAGLRTFWHGEVADTATQMAAESIALAAGASDQNAEYIGSGVDILAGIGPSVAIGVSHRVAMSAARHSPSQVAVGFKKAPRGGRLGHNVVGVTQHGTTAWFDLRFLTGKPNTDARFAARSLLRGDYLVTPIAVSSTQAARSSTAAQNLVGRGVTPWRAMGPNCTTTATEVLRAAGVVVPAWGVSPMLLSAGVRVGSEITGIGGALASGSAAATRN